MQNSTFNTQWVKILTNNQPITEQMMRQFQENPSLVAYHYTHQKNTSAMLCIMYHMRSVNIPQQFKNYLNWQKDKNKEGETPLFLWLRYRQTNLPADITYSNFEHDHNYIHELPIMYWIKYRPTENIPDTFFYNGFQHYRTIQHETTLMYWIKYRPKQEIPQCMLYKDFQQDRNCYGYTPLMLWIQYRQNEPIPDGLKYPDWEKDKLFCGITVSMLWIKFRTKESYANYLVIPDELKKHAFKNVPETQFNVYVQKYLEKFIRLRYKLSIPEQEEQHADLEAPFSGHEVKKVGRQHAVLPNTQVDRQRIASPNTQVGRQHARQSPIGLEATLLTVYMQSQLLFQDENTDIISMHLQYLAKTQPQRLVIQQLAQGQVAYGKKLSDLVYRGFCQQRDENDRTPLMQWIANKTSGSIIDGNHHFYYPGCAHDRDKYGQTPLMLWIINREHEPIPAYLANAQTETYRDVNGKTAIMYWVEKHELGRPPRFLEYPDWQNDQANKDLQTPLMMWIINNPRSDTIQDYLLQGTDVSLKNQQGNTALMLWCKTHKYEINRERDRSFIKVNIPNELLYHNWMYDKNNQGLTTFEIWLQRPDGCKRHPQIFQGMAYPEKRPTHKKHPKK